ncbi:MAG: YbgA family protein [bacterium]
MAHSSQRIRVGISSCLLGEEVRFDGGHKRDRYITDTLGGVVEWTAVCPELEMGLGVPRPSLRLVGDPASPRLVFRKSGEDQTSLMEKWTAPRLNALASADLSGYILKSKSPSCGMERLPVYGEDGSVRKTGVGLFARRLLEKMPLLPVEEEGRLNDLEIRENFIERVFAYRRWQDLVEAGFTRARLVAFHTVHKYLLMAHSPSGLSELGRVVAHAADLTAAQLRDRYVALFMQALAVKATRKKHTNVMHHLLGYLKRDLDAQDKTELLGLIEDYHAGRAPLIAPITLLRHHIGRREIPYLREQIYLNPDPREINLRNHV